MPEGLFDRDVERRLRLLETAITLPPTAAAVPQGLIGYAQVVANQTGISAEADVTGLSVTFTAVAGRYYRLSAFTRSQQVTTSSNQEFYITDSANVKQAYTQLVVAAATNGYHHVFCVVQLSSGSVTYKVRAACSAGTMSIIAAAGGPATLLVEDLGT